MKHYVLIICSALMAASCQTTGSSTSANSASVPAVQVEAFAPPTAGTKYILSIDERGSKKTETWTVLDDSTPHNGVPTLRTSDGANIMVINRNTGNWMMSLDDSGKPLISASPDLGQYAWPLHVGKRWTAQTSYTDHSRGRSWDNITTYYRVAGYEDVTVPAGTFKAFRIDHTPGQSNATTGTIWFAPALGIVVKRRYERTVDHYRGYTQIDTELVEYHPG